MSAGALPRWPAFLAIVAGAFVGASLNREAAGWVFGAVLGWALLRLWRLSAEVAALKAAVARRQAVASGAIVSGAAGAAPASGSAAAAEGRMPTLGTPEEAPRAADLAIGGPTAAGFAISPAPDRPTIAVRSPAQAVTRDDAAAAAVEPTSASGSLSDTAGSRPAATSKPPSPDWLAPVRRWLFGGNTIVKAGVAILFIGLAFLARYASERVQLPVEFRLAGIGVAAIALLAVGWWLRTKRPGYAQVLQGGAVAVLYLVLYVSFRVYSVAPAAPVFATMLLVTALAAALAVLQDARSLAILGTLGGFAAPLLVSTGSGSPVALFGYYLVLDLGIAAVAWFRTWRSLNLIGFLGTFVVGGAWGFARYTHADYASTEAFLVAFFLLFAAILVMPVRGSGEAGVATRSRGEAWVSGSLLFGLPTAVFALQYGLVCDTRFGVALSALAMAAFYVALAAFARRRGRLATVFEGTLAVAVVLLTLVIPFALDARATAGAWALEGAGLVWLGFRQARRWPRVFGYALLLLSGLSVLWSRQRLDVPGTPFDATFFDALLAGAASLAAACFVDRFARPGRFVGRLATPGEPGPVESSDAPSLHGERIAEPLLIGWALLWLVAAAGLEIGFVDPRLQLSAWLAALSTIAAGLTALSVRLDWKNASVPAMAHAPAMAFFAMADAIMLTSPWVAGGGWAWPIALATHAGVLQAAAPLWRHTPRVVSHAVGALVVALLGAIAGRAATVGWGDASSAWPWLGWLVVPAVLLLVLARPGTARRWPVRLEPDAYRGPAAAVLCAALLIWTLLANVASDGSAAPLPHVPLLNPLDLGIGTALAASALWLRGRTDAWITHRRRIWPMAMLAICGFVWLNAILVRAFHHYAGVPYRLDAWIGSFAVQTGLALLWSATALVVMGLSARRAVRAPWIVGASLLGAVTLKLLLFDLAGSGTVARIVSFIGVGVLMLVIGYIAPLPARRPKAADAADDGLADAPAGERAKPAPIGDASA